MAHVKSSMDKVFKSTILSFRCFEKGWGDPQLYNNLLENMCYVRNRAYCSELVSPRHKVHILKEHSDKSVVVKEGVFDSPFASLVENSMDENNRAASFMLIEPKVWPNKNYRPLVVHMAGTGDQGYHRRRWFLANSLLKDGVASLLLTNPFYGTRKPKEQTRSNMRYVTDMFVTGGALVTENLVLLHWLEANGYGPLALHGISMGGFMACLAATTWPKPISLIPCLSWSTASPSFTVGAMAYSVVWKVLESQYLMDKRYANEIWPKLQPSVPWDCLPSRSCVDSIVKPLQSRQTTHTISSTSNDKSSVAVNVVAKTTALGAKTVTAIKSLSQLPSRLTSRQFSSSKSSLPNETVQSMPHSAPSSPSIVSPSQSISTSIEPSLDNRTPKSSASKLASNLSAYTLEPLLVFVSSLKLWRPANGSSREASKISSNTAVVNNVAPVENDTVEESILPKASDANVDMHNVRLLDAKEKSLRVEQRLRRLEVPEESLTRLATMHFMEDVMDTFTHLGHYSIPVDTTLAHFVIAQEDAYVPRDTVIDMRRLWPGITVTELKERGHIGGYLVNSLPFWQDTAFKSAITDSLAMQANIYMGERQLFADKSSPMVIAPPSPPRPMPSRDVF